MALRYYPGCDIPLNDWVDGKCWKYQKKKSKMIEDIEKECLK